MISFDKKILLAPLAGISNPVFRQINKRFGADIVFTEMVSSDGAMRNNAKTANYIKFDDRERPMGIQLFGGDPLVMAEAARLVEQLAKPDLIDINFGCPVRKVVRRNGGSALLKNPILLGRIVEAVVKAVDTPVTAKIRAGWRYNSVNAIEIARVIEQSGATAVTLHPRTQEQGFRGHSNWDLIRQVKEAVHIPVIGNGDIYTVCDAVRMIKQTRCDAVMIGRGSFGNPWLFREIKAALSGRKIETPTPEEKIRTCKLHLTEMINLYGLPKGVYDMRKHFGWYIRGAPGAAEARKRIFVQESPEQVLEIVRHFFMNTPNQKRGNPYEELGKVR